jgi:hypothetical protein
MDGSSHLSASSSAIIAYHVSPLIAEIDGDFEYSAGDEVENRDIEM